MPSYRHINIEYENSIQRQRLRACIVHHQHIIRLVETVKCCTPMILVQAAISLFIICLSAFQMAEQLKKGEILPTLGIAMYIYVMLFQVFIYCWNGNEIKIQSEKVRISAYMCTWYECSQEFKKDFIYLMTRTMRPLKFTMGGFTELSVSMFLGIIKASYSFFTLLQNIDSAKATN